MRLWFVVPVWSSIAMKELENLFFMGISQKIRCFMLTSYLQVKYLVLSEGNSHH